MGVSMLRGQFTRFSGVGHSEQFPDPFLDIASLSMPQNLRSVLYLCEHIYSIFGSYRMAMERIISYFLTEVELLDVSDDEEEKWGSFLNDVLDILSIVQNLLRDRMCYGNAFASLIVPFDRWLSCPRNGCGYSAPLREVYNKQAFQFRWSIPEFIATCPICGERGAWKIDDRQIDEEKKLKVKIWNPHQIELLHDPYTNDVQYLWRIPEDYKRLIREGHLFHLERATREVLQAVHQNFLFRFNEGAIFHLKEPTLGGIVNRGWGVPRILSNFRQIYYVQVLRRFNEAIALDYVVPFRIITPAMRQGSQQAGGTAGMVTDPLLMYNGLDFRNQVNAMIRRRRRDPASLQVLPFPVNFQMFGADANQLAPRELIDQGMETLLNDAGTPIELYNGSLQLQTAPVALRLFESTWHHLIHDTNALLSWLVEQVSQVLSWETVNAKLKRVTIADNLEKQMMSAQLMMSQLLSGTTVLRDLGYSWKQEQKQLAEEARSQAELQARVQEEMQQAGYAQQIAKGQQAAPGGAAPAQPGQPAQPGAEGGMMPPAGPVSQYMSSLGPNVPQTPQDMLSLADGMAQELLGYPESVKDSELRKLKQSNEVLHSLVRSRMDQIRRDTKSSAGNAAMAQFQQPMAA